MAFHQTIEETMSEVLCHMLKRADEVNVRDQLAIGQEYKDGLDESQELEMTYIKEIKKLGQRIEYESVFPPNALNEMEKSIREFDVAQKKEQGNLIYVDAFLFPAGTNIIASIPPIPAINANIHLNIFIVTLRLVLH